MSQNDGDGHHRQDGVVSDTCFQLTHINAIGLSNKTTGLMRLGIPMQVLETDSILARRVGRGKGAHRKPAAGAAPCVGITLGIEPDDRQQQRVRNFHA